jgi:hypothetical protein
MMMNKVVGRRKRNDDGIIAIGRTGRKTRTVDQES